MIRNRSLVRLALTLALFLCPASARAHAKLLRSEPAAGSRITSPRLVMLWFSERPEIALSSATLTDEGGKSFSLGAPQASAGNPLQVSFAIPDMLPAGAYTLKWRTVASDGHPSRGTFKFVVLEPTPPTAAPSHNGSAVPPTTTTQSETMTAPSHEGLDQMDEAASPLNSFARAVSFAGILLVIGVSVFNILVVNRCPRIGSELVGRMESRAAIVGVAASLMVLVGAFARLGLESRMMREMSDMQTMSMADMALHTHWGFAIELEITAAFLALLAFAIGIKRVRGAWLLASIWSAVLAFAPAFGGHAAASPRFTWLMIITDFFHVLGGASWLGNLFCVMLIGVPIALTLEKPGRWESIATLVNTFSPVALASVMVVVASGLVASWVHLEHLSALWSTDYGRVLLIKLALVLITLIIGAYNFRTVQPRLVTEAGTARLRRSAVVELLFGALVVGVTGFLTGISP